MPKRPEGEVDNFPKKTDNTPWEYGTLVEINNIERMTELMLAGEEFFILDANLQPPLKSALGWVQPGQNKDFQAYVDVYPVKMLHESMMADLVSQLGQIFDCRYEGFFPIFKAGKTPLTLEALSDGFRISTGSVNFLGKELRLIGAPSIDRRQLHRVMTDLATFLQEVIEQLYLNSGRLAPDQELVLTPPVQPTERERKLAEAAARQAEKAARDAGVITFADIGGNHQLKEELMALAAGIRDPQIYKRWGIKPPAGILLEGPPGTGKSMSVQALANEAGVTFVSISPEQIYDMWLGNSEKFMAAFFDDADRRPGRTILFIDEIEGLFGQRSTMSHETRKSVQSILFQRTSGMKASGKVTLIGATNHSELLDKALLRPGRFDQIVHVDLPDAEARLDIFRIHIRRIEREANRRIFRTVQWPEIIKKSEGFTGADIEGLLKLLLNDRAKGDVFRRKVKKTVSHEDLLSAVVNFRPEEHRKNKKGAIGFAGLMEEQHSKVSPPKTR